MCTTLRRRERGGGGAASRALLAVWLAGLFAGGGVRAQETEEIVAGKIKVTVTRTDSRTVEIGRHELRCVTGAVPVDMSTSDGFTMIVAPSTEEKLCEALGVPEASPGHGDLRLLRNALARRTTKLRLEPLWAGATEVREFSGRRCFVVRVIRTAVEQRYTARPAWAERPFFPKPLEELSWSEYVSLGWRVEAEYDEACPQGCAISGKRQRVIGRDGSSLSALVRGDGETLFFVPLFFDAERRIIDIRPLLPPDVLDGLGSAISAGVQVAAGPASRGAPDGEESQELPRGDR